MSWTKLPCLGSLLIFQGAIRNFEPSPLAPSCLPAFSCSQPLRGIRMPPIFFWIWINLDNIQVTQTYYQLTWNTPKKNQLVYRWFFNPLPLSQGVAPRPQPYKGSLGLCRIHQSIQSPQNLRLFQAPKIIPILKHDGTNMGSLQNKKTLGFSQAKMFRNIFQYLRSRFVEDCGPHPFS